MNINPAFLILIWNTIHQRRDCCVGGTSEADKFDDMKLLEESSDDEENEDESEETEETV